jgi:hypothetical protein
MGIIRIQDCQNLAACLHFKLTMLLTPFLLCVNSRKLLFEHNKITTLQAEQNTHVHHIMTICIIKQTIYWCFRIIKTNKIRHWTNQQ